MAKGSIKQSVVSRNIGIASVTATILAVVLFALTILFNAAAQKASNDRYDLALNARRFIDGSKSLTIDVRAYAATGDVKYYDSYWREVNTDQNREIGVANMQAIGITEEEQKMIDRMAEMSNQLVPLEESSMAKAAIELYDDAIDDVYGAAYSDTLQQIYELGDKFIASIDERCLNRINTLNIFRSLATFLMGINVIILVVLQLYNVKYVKNALIAPILKVRDVMHDISAGNLSSDFDLPIDESEVGELSDSIHKSKELLKSYVGDISDKLSQMAEGNMDLDLNMTYIGEFESIGKSIKIIMDYLNTTISNLKSETESVAQAVSESAQVLAQSSQEMASGAQEQSDSVEKMVVSVGELTSDMDAIVDQAVDAEMKATQLSESLTANTKQMQDMETAMQDISKSSEGIKSIISAISNIASQTNLLALNASIEAARAGEAGKGFAVVAEEVRVLSEECRDASVQTNELIEQSLAAVNRGVSLTSLTFRAIEEMMVQVTETSKQVGSIAESSRDKVGVLHEINDMFSQLSEVAHSSAETAKESSMAADELNGHAEQLSTLFEQFSLQL